MPGTHHIYTYTHSYADTYTHTTHFLLYTVCPSSSFWAESKIICTRAHRHVHTRTYPCADARTHKHTLSHTWTHTHTRTYIHTHAHTCTCTCTPCITTARTGYVAPIQGVSQQEVTGLVVPLAAGTPGLSPHLHGPLSALGYSSMGLQDPLDEGGGVRPRVTASGYPS